MSSNTVVLEYETIQGREAHIVTVLLESDKLLREELAPEESEAQDELGQE